MCLKQLPSESKDNPALATYTNRTKERYEYNIERDNDREREMTNHPVCRSGKELKTAITQLTIREQHNPIDEWMHKCIRIKHKTYMLVEVNKDRNERIVQTKFTKLR